MSDKSPATQIEKAMFSAIVSSIPRDVLISCLLTACHRLRECDQKAPPGSRYVVAIALIAAVLDAYVDRAVTEKEADSYPDEVVDMSAAADILAQYMKGDTK